MSDRKQQIEQLLHEQIDKCVQTIPGKSNVGKGYRNKVKGAGHPDIPTSLIVRPAPVEIVKEVKVPGPGGIVEKEIKIEVIDKTIVAIGVLIGLAVGVASTYFFLEGLI